jgi:hypothetical protein
VVSVTEPEDEFKTPTAADTVTVTPNGSEVSSFARTLRPVKMAGVPVRRYVDDVFVTGVG